MKLPDLLSFVRPLIAAATLAAGAGHSDAQTPARLPAPSAPLPASVTTSAPPSATTGVRSVRGRPASRLRAGINGPYRAPDDASLVIYDYDKDYTYPIHTLANQETHIQFADDEKVIGVYMSDTKRWILHTAITRQDVMIEPRQPGLRNPTTIITTQRRYELEIRSSDAGSFITVCRGITPMRTPSPPEASRRRLGWNMPVPHQRDCPVWVHQEPLETGLVST